MSAISIFRDKTAKNKESTGTGLKMASDQILQSDLGFTLAAFGQDDEYSICAVSNDNVVSYMGDRLLEMLVFKHFPDFKIKQRLEIVEFIKLSLSSSPVATLSAIQAVAFQDEPEKLTWNRLRISRANLANISLEDMPAFAHILSLMDEPKAFTLWVGSLLDTTSARVQYLHIHGGGGNGKSTLFSAIANVLGNNRVIKTRADEFANQHWGSALQGARLLIFPDENNPGFFSTGKFKEFTGEDCVTINPKYEQQRSIALTHKTVVFSNNKIEISSNVADKRRLLSITMVDDPDQSIGFRWWHDELKNGGEAIVAYCYREYEKAKLESPAIQAYIPQDTTTVEDAVSRKYVDITDSIHANFKITGHVKDCLRRSQVHDILANAMGERKTNRFFMQQIREALLRLGVKNGTAHSSVGVYRGIMDGSTSVTEEIV